MSPVKFPLLLVQLCLLNNKDMERKKKKKKKKKRFLSEKQSLESRELTLDI